MCSMRLRMTVDWVSLDRQARPTFLSVFHWHMYTMHHCTHTNLLNGASQNTRTTTGSSANTTLPNINLYIQSSLAPSHKRLLKQQPAFIGSLLTVCQNILPSLHAHCCTTDAVETTRVSLTINHLHHTSNSDITVYMSHSRGLWHWYCFLFLWYYVAHCVQSMRVN